MAKKKKYRALKPAKALPTTKGKWVVVTVDEGGTVRCLTRGGEFETLQCDAVLYDSKRLAHEASQQIVGISAAAKQLSEIAAYDFTTDEFGGIGWALERKDNALSFKDAVKLTRSDLFNAVKDAKERLKSALIELKRSEAALLKFDHKVAQYK